MRTTRKHDDDVLGAARELAKRQKRTAGRVISDLARRAIEAPAVGEGTEQSVMGSPAFPARGGLVTNERVDRLRQDGED